MALKDLFIKSDATEAPQQVVNNVAAQTQQTATPQPQATVVSQPQSQPTAPSFNSSPKPIAADDKIVNTIWDAIISKNRPGPDYLELKNNVEALSKFALPDDQKLQAAYEVLKKGYPSLQKDDIIKAIDFYINVVNTEKADALKEIDALKAKNVDETETEIKNLTAKADELKQKYDEVLATINAKTIELAQAKNDIEMKYNSFNSSVEAVMNVLQSDKENITNINFA